MPFILHDMNNVRRSRRTLQRLKKQWVKIISVESYHEELKNLSILGP